MARRFRPSNTHVPTRYLFVGNCGPNVGLDCDATLEIFAPFHPIEIEHTKDHKSYVFVVFSEIDSATAALQHFSTVDTSRNFVLRYAELLPAKQPRPECIFHRNVEDCDIPGLRLLDNFLSDSEEMELLEFCDQKNVGWEAHTERWVAHFGVAFDYAIRNISSDIETRPFPECVAPIVEKLEKIQGIPKVRFGQVIETNVNIQLTQLTLNRYPQGIGLASHIDTHSAFTGAIAIVSTGSAAVMLFRRGSDRKRLLLPRKSLLILDDEARYAWEHSLPPNRVERETTDRISFSFRQARGFPCNCAFPQYCDSQFGILKPTRLLQRHMAGSSNSSSESDNESEVENCETLETEYVHEVYDTIALHFSATRFAVWPKVRAFMESLDSGCCVVDIGCGNGKYFNVRPDLFVIGLDTSENLLKSSIEKKLPEGFSKRSWVNVTVADACSLPLRDVSMDAGLCIAVLHHISTINRRLEILKELIRVLRPNGRALVTVWAQEQENQEKTIMKWKPIQSPDDPERKEAHLFVVTPILGVQNVLGTQHGLDYLVPWHLPLHRAEGPALANEISSERLKGSIDSSKRCVVLQRYYHLYIEGELERLCDQLENVCVLESFFDKSNWCVILQKT